MEFLQTNGTVIQEIKQCHLSTSGKKVSQNSCSWFKNHLNDLKINQKGDYIPSSPEMEKGVNRFLQMCCFLSTQLFKKIVGPKNYACASFHAFCKSAIYLLLSVLKSLWSILERFQWMGVRAVKKLIELTALSSRKRF